MLNLRRFQIWFTSGCIAILLCAAGSYSFAQVSTGSRVDWLAGKKLVDNKLVAVSVLWTESPIHDQLNQFALQQRRPIYLDRRVDPTQKLNLQFRDLTTDQIVWETAANLGLGVARVGDLLYVGPKKSACRITACIEAVKKKIPKSARRKWNAKSAISWETATSTEEILDWFEQNHGLQFANEIPHDVWPSADLPSLSVIQQLALILVGFDKMPRVQKDGVTVTLVPFQVDEKSTVKFRIGKKEKFDLSGTKSMFPNLNARSSGKTIVVAGPVEEIAGFEAWQVKRQQAKIEPKSTQTYTLQTTALRGDILKTVAQWTGRELLIDDDARAPLSERVTLDVKSVQAETLLKQCLEGSGLTFQMENSVLRILRGVN